MLRQCGLWRRPLRLEYHSIGHEYPVLGQHGQRSDAERGGVWRCAVLLWYRADGHRLPCFGESDHWYRWEWRCHGRRDPCWRGNERVPQLSRHSESTHCPALHAGERFLFGRREFIGGELHHRRKLGRRRAPGRWRDCNPRLHHPQSLDLRYFRGAHQCCQEYLHGQR